MTNKVFPLLFISLSFLAVSCTKPPVKSLDSTTQTSNDIEKQTSTDSLVRDVGIPLDRALERVTKKPFGLYIDPNNSPVSPEVFRGYHNATDFEILEGEVDTDVAVKAVCDGKLLRKTTATGYGGYALQSCTINDQAVTVIYGHLKLSSIVSEVGAEIKRGDTLGLLGNAYSTETSGERKHLHLGIHKGISIDIRGYVQKSSELSGWLNFEDLVK